MTRKLSYRTKLIAFFLLATLVTFMAGLYNYLSSQSLMQDMTHLLSISQELTSIHEELESIQSVLEEYLSTRNSKNLEEFYDYSNSITRSNTVLQDKADYSNRGIKIKNLCAMVDHYLVVLDQTVIDKRGNQTEKYMEGYEQASKEYAYIGGYIQEIMSNDLSDSAEKYDEIQREIATTTKINMVMLSATVALVVLLIFVFGFEVTKPIYKLASYAKEVSHGNFDVQVADDHSSKEMNILFLAFRMMIISVKDYVHELNEKQSLQEKLSQEKIERLKMKNALREAELLALQSQISPHFIFNTINIGSKIAMLQGDQTTCEYLEDAANVFRYNLRGLDYDATLREEIENVNAYMKLLVIRFGDRVRYRLDIPEDESVYEAVLPRMTLQPIVENAYIHGISKLEEGGCIHVCVERSGERTIVSVSNEGEPFPEDMVKRILDGSYKRTGQQPGKGHTTGIGLDNVVKRLRLFYKQPDVIQIGSRERKTEVRLILYGMRQEPEQAEVEQNVQNISSR